MDHSLDFSSDILLGVESLAGEKILSTEKSGNIELTTGESYDIYRAILESGKEITVVDSITKAGRITFIATDEQIEDLYAARDTSPGEEQKGNAS